MLKNLLNSALSLSGLEIIPKWRIANLNYTRRLKSLFKDLDIQAIIDVGANAGQFRDQMRNEVGFTGRIYSFEPDPTLAAALMQRAAADPAWTVYPVALGAEAGTLSLNIMREPVYNSFHAPSAAQAGGHAHNNTVVQTVDVEVRTLNSMAAVFSDLPRTYFKIDTQGFDLEVLKGAPEIARQVPALQTEVSIKPIYIDSPSMQDSLSAFAGIWIRYRRHVPGLNRRSESRSGIRLPDGARYQALLTGPQTQETTAGTPLSRNRRPISRGRLKPAG